MRFSFTDVSEHVRPVAEEHTDLSKSELNEAAETAKKQVLFLSLLLDDRHQ